MKDSFVTRAALVRSVLHPTDFSPASARAFAHALAIALLRQTDLTILHVSPGKESGTDWSRFPPVRETLERWGLLEAGSPRSAVFDQLRVRVRKVSLRRRSPFLATAAFLNEQASDLIVLATEGREGPSRWIDRSDAEAIARWSHTMTLFVPSLAKRAIVSLETGDVNLRNILVPVDREPDCAAALEFARRAAEVLGDEEKQVVITVLHVGDARAPALSLQDGPKWTWQTENRPGEVVAEILSAADRHAADLIVMATAGHDSVLDALRGSITEQVLRRAPCPLLAVPAA
jgi:nucleotide-binding universal stress UspA family protein